MRAKVYERKRLQLYLLGKLRSFVVSESVLENVYKSLIQSLLAFNVTVWYGNLDVKYRNKLTRAVNLAGKIIGRPQDQLINVYNLAVRRKAVAIIADNTHPLHTKFERLPSGRRFRVPFCHKNKFKHSYVPTAISILNSRS